RGGRRRRAGDGAGARRRGRRARVIRRASPKLGAYAGLSAFGLLAALVVGRPELVALTAPFLLALGAGLALAAPPRLTAEVLADERAIEGDELTVRVRVAAGSAVERLDA